MTKLHFKPAILYADRLNDLVNNLSEDRLLHYFTAGYRKHDLVIPKDDDWSEIHEVLVDDLDNIIGYYQAIILRITNTISSLNIINFNTCPYGMVAFINRLFNERGFETISFAAVTDSANERLYNIGIKRINGKIVGVFSNRAKLLNGEICDMTWYEINRNDFNSRRR